MTGIIIIIIIITVGRSTRPTLFPAAESVLASVPLQLFSVWCGVVWCGVVWCGVVWCGVVSCGVVWCGVV